MDPEHCNSNPRSIRNEQNYPFASKVSSPQLMLKNLELNWRRRLEELFNDTDDQDDYFQVYSEASNASITTICINSNDSRYADSCWSETDFTRRDDIVIQLSESAFYNTKVNPFPQLNFPPSSSSERDEHLNPTEDETGKREETKNEDVVITEVEDKSSEVKEDATGEREEDVVITEVEDKSSEVEEDSIHEIVPLNETIEAVKKIDKDLATSVVEDDKESSSLEINVTDEPKDDQNKEVLPPPDVSATEDIEDGQNNEKVADDGKNNIVDDERPDTSLPSTSINPSQSIVQFPTENVSSVRISIPEVATDIESTTLIRKSSATSRSLSNANSTSEQRKKRYRTRNKSDHRSNVKRLMSQSSGCTEVTSTTTVHVTTNDDAVFDALADMPDFINSSIIDIASSCIDERLKFKKRTRFLDFDSELTSSVSGTTPTWRCGRMSSIYDDYLSPTEAYNQLNTLLTDGTKENLKAVTYDEYNDIRLDDEIPSSEDEFLSDLDDLDVMSQCWTPPESELRRQVAKIVRKLHPLENDYGNIINDMLCKYVCYIDSKQRHAKINRIVDIVDRPITQQEKTELLIRIEIEEKKLNREFYYSPMEPPDFTELGERRREAIVKKYSRCHNDRVFCHNYFKRSIDDRPVSKLGWRVAKLKKEMGLIFA